MVNIWSRRFLNLNFQSQNAGEKQASLFPLLDTACEGPGCDSNVKSPPLADMLNTWSQLSTLFRKVVEFLGNRASLEEMDHCVWDLRFYGPAPFPLFSAFLVWMKCDQLLLPVAMTPPP